MSIPTRLDVDKLGMKYKQKVNAAPPGDIVFPTSSQESAFDTEDQWDNYLELLTKPLRKDVRFYRGFQITAFLVSSVNSLDQVVNCLAEPRLSWQWRGCTPLEQRFS